MALITDIFIKAFNNGNLYDGFCNESFTMAFITESNRKQKLRRYQHHVAHVILPNIGCSRETQTQPLAATEDKKMTEVS